MSPVKLEKFPVLFGFCFPKLLLYLNINDNVKFCMLGIRYQLYTERKRGRRLRERGC